MSFSDDKEREKRKRALRRNMRVNGRLIADDGEEYRSAYDEKEARRVENGIRNRKRRRRNRTLVIAIITMVVFIVIFLARALAVWNSVTEKWTVSVPNSVQASFEPLAKGVIRYTGDGAAYYDASGEIIWTQSFEMTQPISAAADGRVVIADSSGRTLYMFDASGCTGHAETSYTITNISVSQNGYVAVVSENSDAAYINYYSADGTAVSIEVKTVITGEGFPVDISLSKDGGILMVSYASLDGVDLKNRVVFYNFSEEGESATQRIVGGFEQYGESLIADVEMFEDGTAVALAQDRVSFYSLTNRLSPSLTEEIEPEKNIISAAYGKNRVAFLCASADGTGDKYDVTVYKTSGAAVKEFTTSIEYTGFFFADTYLVLLNDKSCEIYTASGNLKYEGELTGNIASLICADGNWYVAGGSTLKRISFG